MAKDIPPIPGTIPAELQRPLQRMREELQRLLGYRGDERAITTANAASLGYLFSGVIGSAGTGGGTAEEPDLTAPPTPTFGDGDAVGGLTNVLLSWGGVSYPQGHGNLQTVIYAVKKATSDPDIPTFPGDAGIVATAPHPLTIYAIPSEPNTRWHLWLKFESVDGVRSLAPAGGTNGVVAVTGQDISQLLQILTNSINTSELAAALAARINLIDADDGVAGSVNARILAETTARIDAVTAETDARILAISNEVDARLLSEDGLQSQIDLLAGSVGGDLATFFDALLSETSSRVEADLAAANAITLANATIADTAFGLNTEQGVRELADAILSANAATTVTGANNTAAGLAVEQQIRAAADGAVASQAASLAVTAGDNAAAVRIEQIARATADDAQANSTVSLAAAGANTAAALQVEQTARATADSAQATSTTIIGAAVAGAAAAIKVEQDARAGADLAAASQIASLSASVASANAAIVFEQEVRASADTATSSQVMALAASVGGSDGISAAAIVVEQQVRATADATLAAQQATLSAATSDNLASVIIEQDARATADSAAAAQSAVLGATAAAALAGLVVEQETRANGIEAVASQSTVLTANVAEAGAAIKAEQLVRAAADDVVASQFGTVGASVGANTAAIQTEQTVRAGADGSAATLIDNALVTAGASMAGILTEQQIRAAADEASARQVESLAAAVAASSAAITLEQNVRADADSSTATQLQTLFSAIGSGDELTSAAIVFEQQTRATADEALAAESTMLRAQAAGNTSAIQNEQVTRATADSATATQAAFIGVAAGTAMAGLTVEQASRVAGDAASTTQNLALQASFANTAAAIVTEQAVRAGADAVAASQVTVLGAKIESNNGTITAAIETEQDARVAADLATASAGQSLAVGLAAASAAITQEQAVRAGADSSAASVVTTLVASTATNTAAIATEQSVRAAETGSLLASYTVKMDLNGYVSGYGLQSSLVAGGTPTSMFLVSVDKFAVMTPPTSVVNWASTTAYTLNAIRGVAGNTDKVLVCKQPGTSGGSAPAISGAIGSIVVDGGVRWQIASRVPFSVLTTNTTINGISVPAGVYIDAAYVLNATVGNAQIGNLAVDNAKIVDMTAAKLLSGSLAVDADISSTGFVAGSSGWRIQGNGTAEFAAATIRGQLTAAQINGNGLQINEVDGTPILRAGAALPASYTTEAAFQAERAWSFNNTADGWTWSGMSSVAANASTFTLVSAGGDPNFHSPVISISGAASTKVRVRLRRLSGALPAGFDCYYKTTAFVPNWNGAYYKNIVPPATMTVGTWVVVEFDMASLTAGTGGGAGYEWTGSTITQIRLDFGAAAGDTYEIDWIAIGSTAPGSYGAPPGSPVGSTTADTVAAAVAAVNDGTTGLAQRLRSNAQNVLAGAGGLATGTLAWNSSGVRTGGYGVGFTQNGIVAYNSGDALTFVLDGSTGNATFAGTLGANTVNTWNIIVGAVSSLNEATNFSGSTALPNSISTGVIGPVSGPTGFVTTGTPITIISSLYFTLQNAGAAVKAVIVDISVRVDGGVATTLIGTMATYAYAGGQYVFVPFSPTVRVPLSAGTHSITFVVNVNSRDATGADVAWGPSASIGMGGNCVVMENKV